MTDAATLCAALLHDTIEDTDATADELRREFGDDASALVEEVTDDKAMAKVDRKRMHVEHAAHISDKAKPVKLADKTSAHGTRGWSHRITQKPIFMDLDRKMRIQTLLGLAAALLPGIVSAQAYGVVAAGLSELSSDCTGTTTCDKTDVAVKLIGGYRFTPSFAGELSYFHLGKATASVGSVSGEVKNAAYGAGVAYHADGPESHFVARIGAARVTTKVNGTIAGVEIGRAHV